MEDIASLSKRKEQRAKVLLSGKKPVVESPQVKKIEAKTTGSPKMKKKLQFQAKTLKTPQKKTVEEKKPFQFQGATFKFNQNTPEKKIAQALPQKMVLPKTPNGFTRFGFKKTVVEAKINKAAQIQSVANKNKGVKERNKEERREIIKGVRSNRRFDLLMQMRNLNS